MDEDLKICYSLLKDYEHLMQDMPVSLCGEEELKNLSEYLDYLENTYL